MTTKQHLRLLLIPVFAILFLTATPSHAAAQTAGLTMSVSAGFDSLYKGEFWVPVQINVANTGTAVEGVLEIRSGADTASNRVIYESPISLPTQSNKIVQTYIFLPNIVNAVGVRLLDENGNLLAQANSGTLRRLDEEALLYGVISPEPDELSFLEDRDGGRSDAAVAFMNMDNLPAISAAWHALDVLVLNDVDSGEMSADQRAAMEQWLNSGGQLVVTGGPGWQKTTAALSDLLPVSVNGVESVGELPALSQHTAIPFRDPGPYVVATSSLTNGELLVHQDGLPLIARNKHGRGAVYFFALDPKLAPLTDWDGSEIIWDDIAKATPRLPFWAIGARNSYSAASAVESLPSLALPSAIGLSAFLCLYVLAIGPINYFVLRRQKRRELAWLTIPVMVVIFTGAAYLIGFQLKGNDVIVNQMSIAFGQVNGKDMRVQSLMGIYSPRRASYNVTLPSDMMVRPFDRNYGGLSGSGNIGSVVRGNDVLVQDMLVDVSGMQMLVGDRYAPMPQISGQVALSLQESSAKLDIQIQNNSDLTLENATILIGSRAVSIGDLKAGESYSDSQTMSSSQTSNALSGVSGGPYGGYSSSGSSPISGNYGTLLGTTDYYNDRDIQGRYQLLESIAPEYGGSVGWVPSGSVTLIFWTEETQVDVQIDTNGYEQIGDTIYFLEVPFSQNITSIRNFTIPRFMQSHSLLGQSGAYDANPDNTFYLSEWVEFSFTPWETFQNITPESLAVVVENVGGGDTTNPPKIRLWDFAQDIWVIQPDFGWGENEVADFATYIGENNNVRVRLEVENFVGTEIGGVYPVIVGDLE
jgi:hypothetical protein